MTKAILLLLAVVLLAGFKMESIQDGVPQPIVMTKEEIQGADEDTLVKYLTSRGIGRNWLRHNSHGEVSIETLRGMALREVSK